MLEKFKEFALPGNVVDMGRRHHHRRCVLHHREVASRRRVHAADWAFDRWDAVARMAPQFEEAAACRHELQIVVEEAGVDGLLEIAGDRSRSCSRCHLQRSRECRGD